MGKADVSVLKWDLHTTQRIGQFWVVLGKWVHNSVGFEKPCTERRDCALVTTRRSAEYELLPSFAFRLARIFEGFFVHLA
jgi:hypothetical protein